MTTPGALEALRTCRVAAIVTAAGRGARFAAAAPGAPPKLLAPLGELTLLATTMRALAAGGVDGLVTVLAPDADARLRDEAARLSRLVIVNPDPAQGMLSSVQAGLRVLPAAPAVCLLHPGDMPFVRPATVSAIIAAARSGRSVSPRLGDRGGHPVALSPRLRDQILRAGPDVTLRSLLYDDDPVFLTVDDAGIIRDVDLPADLADPRIA